MDEYAKKIPKLKELKRKMNPQTPKEEERPQRDLEERYNSLMIIIQNENNKEQK